MIVSVSVSIVVVDRPESFCWGKCLACRNGIRAFWSGVLIQDMVYRGIGGGMRESEGFVSVEISLTLRSTMDIVADIGHGRMRIERLLTMMLRLMLLQSQGKNRSADNGEDGRSMFGEWRYVVTEKVAKTRFKIDKGSPSSRNEE